MCMHLNPVTSIDGSTRNDYDQVYRKGKGQFFINTREGDIGREAVLRDRHFFLVRSFM